MKVSKFMSNKTILYLLVLLVYVCVLCFLFDKHEPWIDEINAWRISKNYSLPEIWDKMHTEGHFIVWFLLMYPFSHMGFDVYWMRIISCVLMSVAAYLIILRSKFYLDSKLFILFSYASIYCFSIVSRCYALIPPILFGLAVIYPERHKRGLLYGLLLGLLANTHLYMEGLYTIVLLFYAYETFYNNKKYVSNHSENRKNVWGVFIAFLGGIIAFLQVIGAFFDASSKKLIGGLAEQPISLVSRVFDIYFCLPARFNLLYFLIYIIVLGLLVYLFYKSLYNKKKLTCILVFSLAYQFLFAIFVAGMNFQRILLPFYIVVFCLWNIKQNIHSRVLIALMCITTSCHGYKYIKNDIDYLFSCEDEVYKCISKEKPQTIYSLGNSYIALESFSPIIKSIHLDNIEELENTNKPDRFSVLYLVWNFETKENIDSALVDKGYTLKSMTKFEPQMEPPSAKGTYYYYRFEKNSK